MKVLTGGLLAALLVSASAVLGTSAEATRTYDLTKDFDDLTHAEITAAKRAAKTRKISSLKVCADPGNMPLSNVDREGYQNKIIETLARVMDTKVVYSWRPYLERGLTRETFDNDECDVLLDMPADYQGLLTTEPIYRSTYVFAYREDSGIDIESFTDPKLRDLRIGVFQHSAIRRVFAKHGLRHAKVHVISHDADLVPERQPWRQVQEVVDGELDIAAVWGPFAGYVKTVHGAPIVVQPVNLMDNEIQLEFDLALGMRTTDAVLKFMLDDALKESKDEITQILTDFGVPLVQCSKCIVAGNLPSHGSYFTDREERARRDFLTPLSAERTQIDKEKATPDQIVTAERLDAWLEEGADVNQELGNAVLASDRSRVERLLALGADVNKQNPQGLAPLHVAARQRDSDMLAFLIEQGADPNAADRNGWTALAYAAFRNHVPSIEHLAASGADLEAGSPGFTPLAVALSEGKFFAAKALIDAGASPDTPAGDDRLTPLMVIASLPQADARSARLDQGLGPLEMARLLIDKGADVNAVSAKGVTPLMVAATHNNALLISLLMQKGADAGAKTPDGKTALDIAKSNLHESASRQIELLIAAKAKAVADDGGPAAEEGPPGQ